MNDDVVWCRPGDLVRLKVIEHRIWAWDRAIRHKQSGLIQSFDDWIDDVSCDVGAVIHVEFSNPSGNGWHDQALFIINNNRFCWVWRRLYVDLIG